MIYASKTPRDLNRDPQPFVGADGSRKSRHSRFAPREDRRPEFDHVQHNEPNPILTAFRNAGGLECADLDVGRFASGATVAQIAHASRVFARLAALS